MRREGRSAGTAIEAAGHGVGADLDTVGKHVVLGCVEFVDALPKTATGKVQKHVLRERGAR